MEYSLRFLHVHESTCPPVNVVDVLTWCLLSDGPPFDFAILCFKKFSAPFQHCLLQQGFDNNPLKDLKLQF